MTSRLPYWQVKYAGPRPEKSTGTESHGQHQDYDAAAYSSEHEQDYDAAAYSSEHEQDYDAADYFGEYENNYDATDQDNIISVSTMMIRQ